MADYDSRGYGRDRQGGSYDGYDLGLFACTFCVALQVIPEGCGCHIHCLCVGAYVLEPFVLHLFCVALH